MDALAQSFTEPVRVKPVEPWRRRLIRQLLYGENVNRNAKARAQFESEFPQWRVVSISPFMPFRYLLSGGVSMRGLSPAWTFGLWRAFERVLHPLNHHLGMFAHIVLERKDVDWSR